MSKIFAPICIPVLVIKQLVIGISEVGGWNFRRTKCFKLPPMYLQCDLGKGSPKRPFLQKFAELRRTQRGIGYSFQPAIVAHQLGLICRDIAPSAEMIIRNHPLMYNQFNELPLTPSIPAFKAQSAHKNCKDGFFGDGARYSLVKGERIARHQTRPRRAHPSILLLLSYRTTTSAIGNDLFYTILR